MQIVLVTVSVDALQLCVVNKSAWSREQTAPYAFELLTDVKHWAICAESLLVEHLVLQAYCLTDIDEINPLGSKFCENVESYIPINRCQALFSLQLFEVLDVWLSSRVIFIF